MIVDLNKIDTKIDNKVGGGECLCLFIFVAKQSFLDIYVWIARFLINSVLEINSLKEQRTCWIKQNSLSLLYGKILVRFLIF